jgi:UDP-GlcNAc:undecaprenyl-phosphate GlcNAc-1-phosphate transferase
MEYGYSLSVALFLTIALIPVLIRVSGSLGLVDHPGAERKLHDKVMPRTGGLGIIIGSALPLAFLLVFEGSIPYIFLGCAIIIVFGLADDRVELNYKWKLFGQSLGAIAVMSGGIFFQQFPFLGLDNAPFWLTYPITFLFLVGSVNGVNFSDGMDGLAAGTSIVALLLVFILALQADDVAFALISVTIVGGLLGFLRFNTSPATIFMGDAGSQFLGFIIACLAIGVTQGELSPYSPLLPLLILGIPIMDILQVVPVRVYKKLPLLGPDKEHFHHQISKLGFRHIEVVAIIYILQTILMVGAYLLRFADDIVLAVFYAVFVTLTLGTLLAVNYFGWTLRANAQTPGERRSGLLRKFEWYFRNSPNCLAVFLAIFFLAQLLYFSRSTGLLVSLLVLIGAGLVSFAISRLRTALKVFRVILYCASAFFAYLISQASLSTATEVCLNGYLVLLTALLVLAIRITRRQVFSLNTQDLLILLVVILLPLLLFGYLGHYEIGRIALRLAVLMYASEFILARSASLIALPVASALAAAGLLLI